MEGNIDLKALNRAFTDSFSHLFDTDPHQLTKNDMEPAVLEEIWTIKNPLSHEEAAKILKHTQDLGYNIAPVTTSRGPVLMPEWRDNKRCMIDDAKSADIIWQRVKDTVPKAILGWTPVGLNTRFRFYQYVVGNYFNQHVDGCYAKSRDEQSFITFQIYLNEGMKGGSTTFFDNIFEGGQWECVPKIGKGVFFYHRGWLHEGSAVTEGIKYTIRSDIMYRKLSQAELKEMEKTLNDHCNVCEEDVKISTGKCGHKILSCCCDYQCMPDPTTKVKERRSDRYCAECHRRTEVQ